MNKTPNDAVEACKRQSAHGPAYPEGYCAKAVREMLGAPSSGDVDHDGDADAMDAWEKVPAAHRHVTSDPHKIPRGVPVFISGGTEGHGHVVVATGYYGRCFSTDMKRAGFFDKQDIADVVRWVHNGRLLGWTDQIGGVSVPVGGVKR